MKNLNNNEKIIVNAAIESYIRVMGAEKWDSLTADQQHDAIMAILTGLYKAIA